MYLMRSDCDPGLTARDRRNLRNCTIFLVPWGLSFMAVHLMFPRGGGSTAEQPLWVWPLIVFAVCCGVAMLWFYLRFIREADELTRKIQLQALAVGFGAAYVYGMSASMLEQVGIPKFAGLTWGVMIIAYSLKLRFGRKAYSE